MRNVQEAKLRAIPCGILHLYWNNNAVCPKFWITASIHVRKSICNLSLFLLLTTTLPLPGLTNSSRYLHTFPLWTTTMALTSSSPNSPLTHPSIPSLRSLW